MNPQLPCQSWEAQIFHQGAGHYRKQPEVQREKWRNKSKKASSFLAAMQIPHHSNLIFGLDITFSLEGIGSDLLVITLQRGQVLAGL